MAVHIVMDCNGDTRHKFDATNPKTLARAEQRFRELTAQGFRAAELGKNGRPGRLLSEFDARVEQTLFIPQLQGG